ncbi:uncharacterized protein LOC132736291, partial [Ruditapes philippinarum]|uniref:uncharacterized protein LOC132736291 n=1 Tax=Ruditapes philippinarum TaxID=129788 RepID=UPI00295B3153
MSLSSQSDSIEESMLMFGSKNSNHDKDPLLLLLGCGAAGLCALRHLTSRPELYEATGLKQLPGVAVLGGTRILLGHMTMVARTVPVAYKNLRTNLPKEVMAFPGFPFPSHLPSFIKHEEVLQYLKDYSQFYKLEKAIM